VYESNGPDVKVRGTAQTVADKYLQLGRDAQSSGDIVMAESYFQHAEHYLRIVFAAQAYNQQAQQQYRRPEEDFDDEDLEDHPETAALQSAGEPEGLGDQPVIEGGPERPQHQSNQGQRQQRDGRDNRDNRDNREQGGRDRFRSRWQDRRGDAPQAQGGEPRQNGQAPQPRMDEQPREAVAAPQAPAAESGRWEAPSFLRRPAPAPAEAAADESPAASAPAPKRRYERRPRKDAAAESPAAGEEDAKAPAAD
jgi:hypothetical protein